MNKHLNRYGFYSGLLLCLFLFAGCATSLQAERAHKAAEEAKEKEIKEKYSVKLGIGADSITNFPLYSFIDDWYNVPYKYSGHSKVGIDCSDFASILLQTVYGRELTGTAGEQFSKCSIVKKEDLQEGDLVFFRINSKNITHVGVYLTNNKFVHASVHAGVIISDLDETYYKMYFYKGGRFKG